MLSLCMKLLETDNEENAVICLRIIFDLHKNFRPTLECEVQPFLDFVQRIYQGRHGRPSTAPPAAAPPRRPHHQPALPPHPAQPAPPAATRGSARLCHPARLAWAARPSGLAGKPAAVG